MELKYTETHEWVRIEGDVATVGITDLAQKELGEVVYVELPRLNGKARKEEAVVVLESTKAAVDLYSPLSGVIMEVNETLRENPAWINKSPLDKGWLFKIKLDSKSELQDLMDGAEYRAFCK